MIRTATGLLSVVLLAVQAEPAIAQSLDASFGRLSEAIGKVVAVLPEDDHSLDSVQLDSSALRNASDRIRPEEAAAYARSLDHDAALLERAAATADAERTAIIVDVAKDLSIKRHAGTGLAAGTTFTGRITVRVVTRRSTNSAPGYVIALNPVRWSGNEPMYRLPKLSPSDGAVPPGRYEVLAILSGHRVARDVVPIGLAGEDHVEIDLPVP